MPTFRSLSYLHRFLKPSGHKNGKLRRSNTVNSVAFIGGLIMISLVGCDRDPMIRVYEVEVRKPNQQPTTSTTAQAGPKRMVGAIVPLGTQSIFLKLMGEPDVTVEYLDEVESVATSLKLDASGNIEFDTPEGWTRGPGSSFAVATLSPPDMTGLDGAMTVTPLSKPGSGDEWLASVQSNLDRWRGQLGLPPVAIADEAEKELRQISSSVDESPIFLVNYLGTSAGKPAMGGPFMQGMMGAGSTNTPSPAAGTNLTAEDASGTSAETLDNQLPTEQGGSTASSSRAGDAARVKYVVPEGWVDDGTKSNSIRVASLKTDASENAAEVSLVFAGGEEASIIELWANSVGKEEITPKEKIDAILSSATEITAGDGRTGKLYRVVVDDDSETSRAILGAIFPESNSGEDAESQRSLFVKMTGSTKVVLENSAKLETFIESLQW